MPKKSKKSKIEHPSDLDTIRITRTLFFVVLTLVGFIIVSDTWNLILRERIVWMISGVALLFVVNTIVWMVSATVPNSRSSVLFTRLALIGASIIMAGLFTYHERGMASTTTPLYVLPILIAATLRNRHILLGTSLLCVATYFYAAVAYFNINFNEGFRVELYSKLLLFTGVTFCITWLAMVLVGLRHDSK